MGEKTTQVKLRNNTKDKEELKKRLSQALDNLREGATELKRHRPRIVEVSNVIMDNVNILSEILKIG
jgi:hypothetical protein